MLTHTAAQVSLLPATEETLRRIVRDEVPCIPGHAVAEGALPPPFVASRSLRFLESGCAPFWALPLHIVSTYECTIVGVCLFKGCPVAGSVEIGYAVAPSMRSRGFASLAVRQMLFRASQSGQAREVFALISPANIASSTVAARTGFRQDPALVDDGGEPAIRWQWRCVA